MMVGSAPKRPASRPATLAPRMKKAIPATCTMMKSVRVPPIGPTITAGAPKTKVSSAPSDNAWLSA
jgi:hypothetical protein